jgi:hypothetical protein
MTSNYIYYVYAYLRNDGTPYYIGKGKGDRAYAKHKRKGTKFIPVPKNSTRIIILESGLSEIGALALERRYIRWWGRKDLGTGILINLTDGGDGNPGSVVSIETRRKMSDSAKGKTFTKQRIKNMSDAQKKRGSSYITEEIRKNMSDAAKGRLLSEETKEKISKSNIGRKLTKEQCESRTGSGNGFYGRVHSEETRRKIAEANKRRKGMKYNDKD